MTGTSKPLVWLPGLLLVVGLFFLTAGVLSGGPDVIGGIVFGAVSLAASAVMLHRRRREAAKAELPGPGAELDDGRR
ncbi:hypothetical protein BH10PLA2_BH10PLA2_27960 [soil metagenome]